MPYSDPHKKLLQQAKRRRKALEDKIYHCQACGCFFRDNASLASHSKSCVTAIPEDDHASETVLAEEPHPFVGPEVVEAIPEPEVDARDWADDFEVPPEFYSPVRDTDAVPVAAPVEARTPKYYSSVRDLEIYSRGWMMYAWRKAGWGEVIVE